MAKDLIVNPVQAVSDQSLFSIQPQESTQVIANRLEDEGYIADSGAFVDYLIYKGYDRLINSGEFYISSSMNAIEIAEKIHSSTGDLTTFTILAGWRVEEIARAMEIYQFPFQIEQLIAIVHHPEGKISLPNKFKGFRSLEGLLFPGQYKVDKTMSIDSFLSMTLEGFDNAITQKMEKAYQKNGLSLEQAVILASVIEKEAIITRGRSTHCISFFQPAGGRNEIGKRPDRSICNWLCPGIRDLVEKPLIINRPTNRLRI